jgi:exodeoxyribonuclease VII large subunit
VLVNPRRYLLQHTQQLDMLRQRLSGAADARLRRARERQAVLQHSLQRFHPRDSVLAARQRSEGLRRELMGAVQARLRDKRASFVAEMRHLDALSPLKVMSRGYSLVYDEGQEQLIKSLSDVELGDLVVIKLNDGQLDCQVWGMKEDGKDDDKGNGTGC